MLLKYPSENSCLFHLFMNRQYQVWQWISEPDSFKVLFIIIVVVCCFSCSFLYVFTFMHEFHGHVIQMEVRGRLRRDLGINFGFQSNIMHWGILLTLVVLMFVFLSRELLILKDFQIVFNLLYILWAAQWYELNTFPFY